MFLHLHQRFMLFTILKNLSQLSAKKHYHVFLRGGWIAAPLSIWNNVTKVLPGNIIEIHQNSISDFYIKNQSYYWNCKQVSIEKQKHSFWG